MLELHYMSCHELSLPGHIITVENPDELILNLDLNDDQELTNFILGAKLYSELCHTQKFELEANANPHLEDPMEPSLQSKNKSKLGAFKSSLRDDFAASDNKWSTAGWATGMAVGQAFDRFRGSVIITPTLATTVMEHTQSSVLTGAVAAGTFFILNKLIGESLNYGLDEFPNSVETFNVVFPGLVGAFTDSLAGIDDKNTHEVKRQELVDRHSPIKRFGDHKEQIKSDFKEDDVKSFVDKSKIVGKHLLKLAKASFTSIKENASLNRKRAFACIGIGPTPFVATAAANGYTRKERSRVTDSTVGATSVLVGSLGFGLSESVIQLAEHGHQEAALDVQNIVSSTWVWLGMAALSMGSEFISNRLEKRKQASKKQVIS